MNTIPQDDWNRRLLDCLSEPRTKEKAVEAFLLYNDRFRPRETKTFCGGCTERVFKKLNECKTNTNQ